MSIQALPDVERVAIVGIHKEQIRINEAEIRSLLAKVKDREHANEIRRYALQLLATDEIADRIFGGE